MIKKIKKCKNHIFRKKIATDWTRLKIVPTPVCVRCKQTNKDYDFENEDNKFYLKYWNLYR